MREVPLEKERLLVPRCSSAAYGEPGTVGKLEGDDSAIASRYGALGPDYVMGSA